MGVAWSEHDSDCNATTCGFTLLCCRENRGCPIRIIQVAHVPQQTCDRAVKLCQQLLTHRQFRFQRFQMASGVVEPHQIRRQVNESNAAFAADLHGRWWTEPDGFLPRRLDVIPAADLGSHCRKFGCRREIEAERSIPGRFIDLVKSRGNVDRFAVDHIATPVDQFDEF